MHYTISLRWGILYKCGSCYNWEKALSSVPPNSIILCTCQSLSICITWDSCAVLMAHLKFDLLLMSPKRKCGILQVTKVAAGAVVPGICPGNVWTWFEELTWRLLVFAALWTWEGSLGGTRLSVLWECPETFLWCAWLIIAFLAEVCHFARMLSSLMCCCNCFVHLPFRLDLMLLLRLVNFPEWEKTPSCWGRLWGLAAALPGTSSIPATSIVLDALRPRHSAWELRRLLLQRKDLHTDLLRHLQSKDLGAEG